MVSSGAFPEVLFHPQRLPGRAGVQGIKIRGGCWSHLDFKRFWSEFHGCLKVGKTDICPDWELEQEPRENPSDGVAGRLGRWRSFQLPTRATGSSPPSLGPQLPGHHKSHVGEVRFLACSGTLPRSDQALHPCLAPPGRTCPWHLPLRRPQGPSSPPPCWPTRGDGHAAMHQQGCPLRPNATPWVTLHCLLWEGRELAEMRLH